ncbi:porin [Psychromarinibacter halotolerans]|uniref:Porin n=1 Tax=Psychromarinibacter halotolerans TaxID=1775175 RepID=A0ABV7GNT0_9RHOB|nr:porin [Psychromarinibacter halotolerans]MDF0595591.1 porin [Psychromarinibacter halotolerans]
MKKVLFATTALVASAGIASAQGVSIGGWAEMGIVGGGVYGDEVQFWTDIDVEFRMSGETDNGLTFGAGVDLDENGAFAGTTQGGEFIFISGAFGTLTMGDTDGALDWALSDVGMGASIDDAHTSHAGYNGNNVMDGFDGKDGQIARYDYSFGDFAFAVSAEIDDSGVDDPTFGVGATYATSFGGVDLGFGIGYQAASGPGFDSSAVGASVDVMFAGGFHAILNYTSYDDVVLGSGLVVDSHYAIGLGYTTGAISVSGNYGMFEGTGDDSQSGFGLQAAYDLGGGAEVQFGYGYSEMDMGGVTTDTDQFSLGVAMSF